MPDILENALLFISTDACPLLSEPIDAAKTLELYWFAVRYKVPSLYSACTEVFVKHLSESNVLCILRVARQTTNTPLADAARSYLKSCDPLKLYDSSNRRSTLKGGNTVASSNSSAALLEAN